MKRADWFSRFYTKCFIGIAVGEEGLEVHTRLVKSGGNVEARDHYFEGGEISEELVSYLEADVQRTPYNYIALFDDAISSGAVPTCLESKAIELAPAVESSRTTCIDEEWMDYADEEELYGLERRFESLKPDAFYTPFSLIHTLFAADMVTEHALYLLKTPRALALAVVKNGHLRLADLLHNVGPETDEAEWIKGVIESYYGKPCCRGEFIESAFFADASGAGSHLGETVETLLFVDVLSKEVSAAEAAAMTCAKEAGYGL